MSFKLLYLMDEVTDPAMTILAEGHQWYWTYQYVDFINDDTENIEFDSYMMENNDKPEVVDIDKYIQDLSENRNKNERPPVQTVDLAYIYENKKFYIFTVRYFKVINVITSYKNFKIITVINFSNQPIIIFKNIKFEYVADFDYDGYLFTD